jgi:3-hydroxyacyl-CoA dehydrogenase
MSEIIGVIGAGTMGNGIAQAAASAGFDVVMCDVKPNSSSVELRIFPKAWIAS